MNIEVIKECLLSLALADHIGDVNDTLPVLCKYLELPAPTWHDSKRRWVFEWEVDEEE